MENTATTRMESFGSEPEQQENVAGGPSAHSKECNFSASDLFYDQMRSMVCSQDVMNIRRNQQHSLHRFEKTNEMFERFNELSAATFEAVQGDFRQHTKLLVDLKKDLETVFRRIRNLKSKLSQQYPEAFEATNKGIKTLEEELEEDQNQAPQDKDNHELKISETIEDSGMAIPECGINQSQMQMLDQ